MNTNCDLVTLGCLQRGTHKQAERERERERETDRIRQWDTLEHCPVI